MREKRNRERSMESNACEYFTTHLLMTGIRLTSAIFVAKDTLNCCIEIYCI